MDEWVQPPGEPAGNVTVNFPVASCSETVLGVELLASLRRLRNERPTAWPGVLCRLEDVLSGSSCL